VYGKILEINRSVRAPLGDSISTISYTYDAAGNRIGKKVVRFSTTRLDYTWYVRDAQGNIMGVYNYSSNSGLSAGILRLNEQHIYGSSRIGILNRDENVEIALPIANYATFTRGNKFFELSNHLGNVLVTVSDRKTSNNTSPIGAIVTYYKPVILTANDYYPFGMIMPGRNFNASGVKDFRFGFNGKMNDNDVKNVEGGQQDYGMRIYDGRIGKFLSVDPLQKKFAFYTPYQFAGNTPIAAIDLDGLEPYGRVILDGQGDGAAFWKNSKFRKTGTFNMVQGNASSGSLSGDLYLVTDAKNIQYHVLRTVTAVRTTDSWGITTTEYNKDYFYFSKPPMQASSNNSYEGGTWIPFDTENKRAFEQSVSVAEGIGTGAFGAAAGISAAFAAPSILSFAGRVIVSPAFNSLLSGDIAGGYMAEYAGGATMVGGGVYGASRMYNRGSAFEYEAGSANTIWQDQQKVLSYLQGEVNAKAAALRAAGENPASVSGAWLPGTNQYAIGISGQGMKTQNIAPQLQLSANSIGGIGTKTAASGNTVGACSEFSAANTILRANPFRTPTELRFTPAIEPRRNTVKATCANCQKMFGSN
jgi:RHS repeat-associated protein